MPAIESFAPLAALTVVPAFRNLISFGGDIVGIRNEKYQYTCTGARFEDEDGDDLLLDYRLVVKLLYVTLTLGAYIPAVECSADLVVFFASNLRDAMARTTVSDQLHSGFSV